MSENFGRPARCAIRESEHRHRAKLLRYCGAATQAADKPAWNWRAPRHRNPRGMIGGTEVTSYPFHRTPMVSAAVCAGSCSCRCRCRVRRFDDDRPRHQATRAEVVNRRRRRPPTRQPTIMDIADLAGLALRRPTERSGASSRHAQVAIRKLLVGSHGTRSGSLRTRNRSDRAELFRRAVHRPLPAHVPRSSPGASIALPSEGRARRVWQPGGWRRHTAWVSGRGRFAILDVMSGPVLVRDRVILQSRPAPMRSR